MNTHTIIMPTLKSSSNFSYIVFNSLYVKPRKHIYNNNTLGRYYGILKSTYPKTVLAVKHMLSQSKTLYHMIFQKDYRNACAISSGQKFSKNTHSKKSSDDNVKMDNITEKNVNRLDKINVNSNNDLDDPFGLVYEDTFDDPFTGNIGPRSSFPPKYIRDFTTNKFTGKIEEDINDEVKDLLHSDDGSLCHTSQRLLTNQIEEHIDDKRMNILARRIRERRHALNVLGRKPSEVQKSIKMVDTLADGEYSTPLTAREYDIFRKFLRADKYDEDNGKSKINNNTQTKKSVPARKLLNDMEGEGFLLPHINSRPNLSNSIDDLNKDESTNNNSDLDLEWTTTTGMHTLSGIDARDVENPFANLLPSDLNPSNLVNCRKAKRIPKILLHHNNLLLLRRYVTPGGQIMSRRQSRLGAKDQRKIAKLVKRARHIGLIPHQGQWKVEDHGNTKEDDLFEERTWERKLVERGLVKRNGFQYKKLVRKLMNPSE